MIILDKAGSPLASTSERKLAIELPDPRQIYTVGSVVSGIVRLGAKDTDRAMEVKVSLMCVVRSVHHKYYGGSSHDFRRETNKLIQCDQILWSCSEGDNSLPPTELPFHITIPDVGHDQKAKNPSAELPPSFHGGSRHGWKSFGTHGTPIGFIKYHVKVVVTRKGTFTHHNKAYRPFIFLPSSPPPPLLPQLPEQPFEDPPATLWVVHATSSNLRNFFTPRGSARLQLWLPRVSSLPRKTRIPFVLRFELTTQPIPVGRPREDGLPPAAQVEKATMYLRQAVRTVARGGKDKHVHTLDSAPTDNILHGLVPDESEWIPKTIYESGAEMWTWEKRYVWRGMWMCRETPNFQNRQISCEYALLSEIPIKGLGNGVKLVSGPIDISSGVIAGSSHPPSSEDDMLDLPPDYFDIDGAMGDDAEDEGDEKSQSGKR